MAKERKKTGRKRDHASVTIPQAIAEKLREYVEHRNAECEESITSASSVAANAIRIYLRDKGFWPANPTPKSKD